MSPVISGGSSGGGALSGVTVTGTAAAGQVPVASSSSAGAWGYPPGYEFDYVPVTGNTTVTATSAATAQTWIDGNAVTYDGSTRVKIETWTSLAEHDVAAAEVFLELYDGATDLGTIGQVEVPAAAFGGSALKGERFLTPSAAAHTYHIKAWRSGSGGTATLYAAAGGAGVNVPAFYRITKA